MKIAPGCLSLLLVVATACGAADPSVELPPDGRDAVGIGDGKADGFVVSPGSPEAQAVLALVNRPIADLAEAADLQALLETRLHRIPAEGIIAFRLGADELPGGPQSDDQTFAELRAVDSIPYVGPVALRRLWEIADDEGLYTAVQHEECPQVGYLEQPTSPRPYGRARAVTQHSQLLELHQSGCTKIRGTIKLALDLPAGQRELEAFEHIESIGMLVIDQGIGVEGLSGLGNVREMGSLWIHSFELADLRGLEGITSLTGALDITQVGSLDGLQNLQSVGGKIHLNGVDDVTALSNLTAAQSLTIGYLGSYEGLHNLEQVEHGVSIGGYPETGARVLPALVTVGASLDLNGSLLADVRGFDALESVGGPLILDFNEVTTADGFGKLEAVGGLRVRQRYNGTTDLSGFANLEYVGGDVVIETALPSPLTGLGAIETIEGDLDLSKVRDIADFSDLSSLSAIGDDLIVPRAMNQDVVDAFVLSLDHFNGDVTLR